jgi:hypothetical protein
MTQASVDAAPAKKPRGFGLGVVLGLVAGCFVGCVAGLGIGSSGSSYSPTPTPTPAATDTPAADPTAATAPRPAGHHWRFKEGLEYGYESEVSENEKKAGQAAGDVLMFRYLGEKDGVYTIRAESDSEVANYSCANPCELIKEVMRDPLGVHSFRRPYAPNSVVGGALADAFSGELEVYRPTKTKASGNSDNRADQ